MRLEEIEPGICKECGCTWTTPCVDQKFGPCWWMEQTDAKMSDFEDFLDDLKGSVAIFKKE